MRTGLIYSIPQYTTYINISQYITVYHSIPVYYSIYSKSALLTYFAVFVSIPHSCLWQTDSQHSCPTQGHQPCYSSPDTT